jgi:hypothetical protein
MTEKKTQQAHADTQRHTDRQIDQTDQTDRDTHAVATSFFWKIISSSDFFLKGERAQCSPHFFYSLNDVDCVLQNAATYQCTEEWNIEDG